MLGIACDLLEELSQVQTTASRSSLPLSRTLFKIICSHHPGKLSTRLTFLLFLPLCVSKISNCSLRSCSGGVPRQFPSPETSEQNVWGLLLPLHYSPVCTRDRTLSTWFPSSLFISLSPPTPSPDSEQCESRIFSLIIHVSWKPVSEFGRTHIGREERNEVKWNEVDILGKWATESPCQPPVMEFQFL